ncbi:MAG: hypothetical protein M3Z66_09410, partial [Chloroflexota bacterium]|nr:hypothetical protein [Chloroflexota bacterium]
MLARFSARPSVASLLLTLRSRLVISTLLITLAGLLVVVLVFLQVLAQRSYDIKQHELATQAQHVARAIHRLYLGHAGNTALRTRVYDASRLLGERIIILGATGSIVVDSSGYTPFDTGSWYEIDLHALQRGASAGAALQSQKTVIFQSPIHGTRGHVDGGAVLLVAKVTDVRPSFFSLIEVAAALIATALVVWLLIGT